MPTLVQKVFHCPPTHPCLVTPLMTLLDNVSIKAISAGPGQTAPTAAVRSESTLFVEEASKAFQHTAKAII